MICHMCKCDILDRTWIVDGSNRMHVDCNKALVDPAKQALDILTKLEAWADKPGRGFTIARSGDGRFRATLLEVERRTSTGETMADCLAQVAQVVEFEPKPFYGGQFDEENGFQPLEKVSAYPADLTGPKKLPKYL